MSVEPIITDILKIMNKICYLKGTGMEIVHQDCPTDLSWVWRDKATDHVIDTLKLSRIRAIMPHLKKDPRIKHLLAFAGGSDACIALSAINKLNSLKAFW